MGFSKDIRQDFPALHQGIYANTATTGLLSQPLLEWRRTHDQSFLNGGSTAKEKVAQLLADTRSTIGQFFGFESEHIALVPSFSQGLNLLLEGLRPDKEKVLLIQGDYPSLIWPFISRGVPVQYVEVDANLQAHIHDRIQREGITVFACSMVQWHNGLKMDEGFLKRLKVAFPELLILADATQYCGTGYFDFSESGIDILGTSGYKWLLAGYGNGFFLVKPEVQHRFLLKSRGYGSGRNAVEQRDGRSFCKQLEPGHLDSLSFGSLRFSLAYLMRIGLRQIEQQNLLLSNTAKALFSSLGVLDPLVMNSGAASTIFTINTQTYYPKLLENKVLCAQRGAGIRLSFHFYNTQEEIERIGRLLKT